MNKRKKFLVSSYLYSLSVLGFVGLILCIFLTVYFLAISCNEHISVFFKSYSVVFIFLGCLVAVYLLVCAKNAYEFWGAVEVTEEELILSAPLKRSLRFRYADIVDIGMDYGWVTVNRQYWIYVGKKQIPHTYCHRINRLPINQEFIRFQFSEDVFWQSIRVYPRGTKRISIIPLLLC